MMRTTASDVVVLLALLAWQGTSSRLSAGCIRLNESFEQEFMRSSLVFVADVLAIDIVLQPDSHQQRVRFQVIEAYRGTERGEQVVLVRPTAEDFKFEVSQRVLVYANGTRDLTEKGVGVGIEAGYARARGSTLLPASARTERRLRAIP